MATALSVSFTGSRFENPFLLASAPPTESENNILGPSTRDGAGRDQDHRTASGRERRGPENEVLSRDADSTPVSMKKRSGAALLSSWNWELISDKTLDWWVPRIGRIKKAHPNRVLVASIMAGSGSDAELSTGRHWHRPVRTKARTRSS